MSKCDNCRLRKESAKAFDIHWHGEDDCPYAKCPVPNFPKTNADRIRGMSDEKLAEFMCHNVSNGTVNCAFCAAAEFCRMGHNGWIDWLKEETET